LILGDGMAIAAIVWLPGRNAFDRWSKVIAGRRGAGEGSVYWDAPLGLWAASVDLGINNGKRVRKVVRAKTKRDVLTKMRELHATVDAGLPIPDRTLTTGDWLTWWVNEVLPGTVKSGTATNYRDVLSAYVIPHVGRVALAKLGPEHVQAMMRALERSGRSPRTVSLARTVLRRSLGDAVRWGKVNRNAAGLVRPPRNSEAKLDDALDAEEAMSVLNAAVGSRLEALAALVLGVGLRQGEALSLRWLDVDLDAGIVTIRVAKTDAGRRTVTLPPFVVGAMMAHKSRQLDERSAAGHWEDPELVFASTVGTKLDRRNVLRWWHDLTVRDGVGRRRFHASWE
jgi:integrase